MKKGLILFVALTLLTAVGAFAKVTAVKDGDAVKVTWTYTNTDAGSVGLVGDFQGWNLAGASPMTKGADGSWSITLTGKANSEYLYKFNVDGEWTEDPEAPATFDDGFGGLNGKVVVAELLSAGPGDAPAGPKLGLAFATYTQGAGFANFLTKDVKTGKIDGFELDEVGIALKSYWKFAGDFLPGNRLDLELAVVDNGGMTFWKSNTQGTDTPFTTVADGLHNVADFFFDPFTNLAKQQPYIGHFKYTLKTPIVKILQAYHYAKGTIRDEYNLYTILKEDNSGDGTVEITNPAKIELGGLGLSYMVGLSKRTGKYGVFDWIDLDLSKDSSLGLAYTSITEKDSLYQYWKKANNLVNIGYNGKFGDIKLIFDSLVNFKVNDYSFDGNAAFADMVAAGLKVVYSANGIGLTALGSYAGDSVETLYGNDDNLNKGKIKVELDPSYTLGTHKFGLDYNTLLDNMSSTTAKKPAIETYLKPYAELGLGDLSLALFGKVNLNIIDEATDAKTPLGIKFNEADVKANIKSLGLTAWVAYVKNNGDWNSTAAAYKDNGFDLSLVTQYDMADQLSFFLGGIYRATGADEAAADYDKESKMGFSVGVNKVILSQDLKNPRLYALFDYNMNPWDGDYKTGLDMEDGNYRWDDLNNGKGKGSVRTGVVWSF